MDGSTPSPFLRRMSSLSMMSPPVCSTNFVLEIADGVIENNPLQMGHQKKSDNANQLWVWEENGLISSAGNKHLVIGREQGSHVIAARRKDDVHNWHQQWEFHKGYIRSMSNHNLVLDVEYRSALEGATVCVFRPHKHGDHENQQWGLKVGNKPYTLPTRSAPQSGDKFDSSKVELRLSKMWNLNAVFGKQTSPEEVFFNQIVSNRYCLTNGVQLIRDELQLAFEKGGNLMACAADLTLPSAITTLAYTNCGDRINHSFHKYYNAVVGSRFASVDAEGELKTEHFSPAGGGTDDGGVLAHVTVSHQLDETIRKKLYEGNKSSYVLVNIDLMTHVGCNSSDSDTLQFGVGSESEFREPRGACGAIIASLTRYNQNNVVHDRIKRNLGTKNFEILHKKIKLEDGTDITYVVAAAIVAVRGLHDTCQALTNELDSRGVAHVTASTTVNTTTSEDHLFFLARATVFSGKIRMQGFGIDASKYSGVVEEVYGRKRLVILYDGKQGDQMEIDTIEYTIKDVPA